MSKRLNDPLLVAGKVVVLLSQGLLALGALAISIVLPVALIMRDRITAEVVAETGNAEFVFPALAFAAVLILVLAVIVMAFLFLDKLRRMIDTVDDGDPFVPENARRLTSMAWLALAIQLLAIPAAGLALYLTKLFESQDATIDAGFDFGGAILIITLFILARVFRKGTEMREDLEGTV